MSGAHLFTPGRHFNKQRIQQGAQMQSIKLIRYLSSKLIKFQGYFGVFLLTHCSNMFTTFQLLAAQLSTRDYILLKLATYARFIL